MGSEPKFSLGDKVIARRNLMNGIRAGQVRKVMGVHPDRYGYHSYDVSDAKFQRVVLARVEEQDLLSIQNGGG